MATINAYERRDIIVLDVTNAFFRPRFCQRKMVNKGYHENNMCSSGHASLNG